MEARGDGAAYDPDRVGCHAERRFRSDGFRTELRWWAATDGGGRWRTVADSGRGLQTVADSVEMLFDSVG